MHLGPLVQKVRLQKDFMQLQLGQTDYFSFGDLLIKNDIFPKNLITRRFKRNLSFFPSKSILSFDNRIYIMIRSVSLLVVLLSSLVAAQLISFNKVDGDGDTLVLSLSVFGVNYPPVLLIPGENEEFSKNVENGAYVIQFSTSHVEKHANVAFVDPATHEGVWRVGFTGPVSKSCWIEIHNTTFCTAVLAQCTTDCATSTTNFARVYSPFNLYANVHVESDCGVLYPAKSEDHFTSSTKQKVAPSIAARNNHQAHTFIQDFSLPVYSTEEGTSFRLFGSEGQQVVTYAITRFDEEKTVALPVLMATREFLPTPENTSESEENSSSSSPSQLFDESFWWVYVLIALGCLGLIGGVIVGISKRREDKDM
jgi:hypothetical protein